jgi:hypothetical protein
VSGALLPRHLWSTPHGLTITAKETRVQLRGQIKSLFDIREISKKTPMAPASVIRLHPDDGVLIARASLPVGMLVADGVTTLERIPELRWELR